ncbi:SCL-interrupting locus protein homolog isoform X2 [Anabas testudineus]|uniref:SCL-interrupting locus protein homolog isoform X2 n=1 Tax=Anabas testudineus TaxID=64144 RepID=UPI000E45617D|nr:SCL-interrupting locus protein homolog isoform X2 [Anabas testudineus]
MSFPVNLQALPTGVLEEVFTPENVRGRSRSALWDGSPAGEKLRLHLGSHRKPRLVLLEKTLRLAQRHVRHSNKPHLHAFFLGSVSVDSDEEGVTITLDRFDLGREQTTGRVPSALLPGDVLVPCLFSSQSESVSDSFVQSEAELHHHFKVLQQFVSSRQTLDLSQLLKVRGHLVCSQQSDAAAFCLSWSAICPSISVDVQPVRAIPIIPTALLRSLTNINRPLHPSSTQQRGFLTMDQTRKLLLLLESDPKASTLPLVGLWLSGVTHVYNPQVWAWCLRFLFSSSLQDRVLSESGYFLLVLFGSTHRAPQFFQCQGLRPGPAAQLNYQLLTALQSVTLHQVASVDGQTLQCELGSDSHSRQMEVFTKAQTSFNRTPPPAASLSVSDQDSGVEDEDLSPRPSPSPHAPAQQTRRVQPSVPELSLLIDSSFITNLQPPASTHRAPPPAPSTGKITTTTSSAPTPTAPYHPLHHLHSTPNSNLQQPCSCCSTHTYDCTPIFSSPRLQAATAPPPSNLHPAAPPPSVLHPAAPPPSVLHPAAPPPSVLHPAAPPPSVLHPAAPPPSSLHPAAPPPSQNHTFPPFRNHLTTAPLSSNHCTTMLSHEPAGPSSTHQPTPPSFSQPTPPLSHTPSSPLSIHHHTPSPSSHYSAPPSTLLLPASSPRTHPPLPWCGDSPSPDPSHPPDPKSPSWLTRPSCVNPCCNQGQGPVQSDTYQLLLHQDQQLRLLQAQVQMLLEAQMKLQSSSQQDPQTTRSTASIAVGTGASLLWGHSDQLLALEETQAPFPSSSPTPCPSFSPSQSSSSRDLSIIKPLGEAEDDGVPGQVSLCSPSRQHSVSGLQSPVLGESVSMYRPADDQQSFYHNLMTQLTSRLQESDSKQEVEADKSKRSSLCVVSDCSQSSQTSQTSQLSSLSKRKQQSPVGDPVVSATLRQLRQLGVDVDEDILTESGRDRLRTVESTSTLASIYPAAVVSRLSVSDPTVSSLFPGGSVDLSLEANAIALRYLSDSQLSRLSLGASTPRPAITSSCDSLLSPSNMSLATRKYMRRYGLFEEEDGEDEEEQEEVRVQEASSRQPLTEALNVKLLPQSQLIRDLRPKMQLLVGDARTNSPTDKENCSSKQTSLIRASSRPTEGSVGNILDLSRLRQLPKLF